MSAIEHKPIPIRTQSRCRVNCSCGWRGPLVSMPGHGYEPWAEHYKEATDGVSAQVVPAGLPDTRPAREPWEFFDGD